MLIEEAAQIFGIADPTAVTENSLKLRYQQLAAINHPDNGGDHDSMCRINRAYSTLRREVIEIPLDAKTSLGHRVADLGKGLPQNKNGIPCKLCDARGFTVHTHAAWSDCTGCKPLPSGAWSYACRRCEGSGRNVVSGKDCGLCKLCYGAKWFIPRRPSRKNVCRTCNGIGLCPDPEKPRERIYLFCSHCKGCGEIEMFNPVLRKHLLTGV